MRKHAARHRKARWIEAAANPQPFIFEAAGVEWIQAQAAEGQAADAKPKRFSMTAYTGGALQVSAYGLPVVIDLSGLKAESPVPILLNHEQTEIVGHAEEVDLAESHLKLKGVVSGESTASKQVTASAAMGFPWRASVGARPDKLEFVGEDVATKVNGKSFKGPLYVARKATLGEVSFVAVAADSRTSAKVAASAAYSKSEKTMNPEFRDWLLANSFDPEALAEASVPVLQAAWTATKQTTAPEPVKTPPSDPTADIRAKAAAESTRISAIEAMGAKYTNIAPDESATLKAKAIGEGWDTRDAELAFMRADRPKAPAIHASSKDISTEVIQAALCRSGGLRGLDKAFKPEVLEASDQLRGYSLGEAILRCAAEGGYTGRQKITDGNLREVLRAAFSTHTLTTMLSTAGNKFLLEGFLSIPQLWREVAAVRSLNDFKTHTGYRLTASLEYEEVGPSGEITHGTVGQESYTMSLVTFGKMLAFTRKDIINDDLGALDGIKQRLGIGAAVKMENLFWTVFLAASNAGTFWTSARGNLVTSSALAEAGLNTAVMAFRDMAAPDGNMMNLEPRLLLVPTALEATAKKIYVSQEIRDTTSSTKYPTANIYQNSFRPIPVPQLGNSAYTGYSATTWYLLADPSVMACAAMCFLNGQQSPTIESADADFDTLGIQFRGYHDFYPVMTEYRPTVKATAA
jgi:hypothetical protein